MTRALTIALVMLCCAPAGATDQTMPPVDAKPLGDPKSVTTTIIKRCPDGYELVTRASGRHGCAKDVLPANE